LREELAILLQQLEALQQQLGAANEPFVPVPVPVLIEAAPVNGNTIVLSFNVFVLLTCFFAPIDAASILFPMPFF
jgi:hypothetical protein